MRREARRFFWTWVYRLTVAVSFLFVLIAFAAIIAIEWAEEKADDCR